MSSEWEKAGIAGFSSNHPLTPKAGAPGRTL